MKRTFYAVMLVVACLGAAFITAVGDLTRTLENFVFIGLVLAAWWILCWVVIESGVSILDWINRRWDR